MSWPQNVASVLPLYKIDSHQAAIHLNSNVKSPCYNPSFASQPTDQSSLSTQWAVHQPPPSTNQASLYHVIQSVSLNCQNYSLQVRTIIASICISKLAQSQPPSVSPDSHNYGLQVHPQTRSIMASKCTSECTKSLSLQVHLQTRIITISECISEFTWSWHLYVSPNMLDYHLQVHLQTRSNTASDCIYKFTRLSLSGTFRIALKHWLHPVQMYFVSMGSYIDT
jgi:hypothetical protein